MSNLTRYAYLEAQRANSKADGLLKRVREGKNKFSGIYTDNITFLGDTSVGFSLRDNDGGITAFVKVEPNKTYTVWKSNDSDRFGIGTSINRARVGDSLNRSLLDSSSTNTSFTLTTQENENYIIVYLSSPDQTSPPSQFQVEEGDEVTSYSSPTAVEVDIEKDTIPFSSLNKEDVEKGLFPVNPEKTSFVERQTKNKFLGEFTEKLILTGSRNPGFIPGARDGGISAIVKIEPDTTYTISRSLDTDRFRIGLFENYPEASGERATFSWGGDSTDGDASRTVTAGAGDNYLFIYLSSVDENKKPEQLQVEEGDQSTSYVKPNAVDISLADKTINEIAESIEWNIPENSGLLTVKDFGAVGDGVTDDTSALNNAFANASNGSVFIPEGTFLFSDTLNVPTGIKIYGCGEASTLKLADNFTLTEFPWRNSNTKKAMMLFSENADGCILENFAFVGQTANFVDEGQTGITVRGTNHSIRNIIMHDINYFPDDWEDRSINAPAWGLAIIDAENVNVIGGHYYNCGYECLGTESAKNISISDAVFGTANRVPVQFHRNSENITINGCRIYLDYIVDEGVCGITLHGVSSALVKNVIINACVISRSVYGVYGGEYDITMSNNRIDGDVRHTRNNDNIPYDEGWIVLGNDIKGIVRLKADSTLVTNNIIDASGVTNAVEIEGNKVKVDGNLFLNEDGVEITPH